MKAVVQFIPLTLLVGCLVVLSSEVKAGEPDAFCICVTKTDETSIYNLRGTVPQGCKKYLFHSSTHAPFNAKSKKARNKMGKKGMKKSKKSYSSTSRPKPKKKLTIPKTGVASTRTDKTGEPPETPFNAFIESASKTYDIPVALIHAVVRVESNYKPDVVSSAGAQGLMQLMPGTASDMKVTDPFDPEQNIQGGTKYLRRLADHYDGDIIKTLAAYHAGFRAVDKKNGIPYEQTEKYVKKVLSHYYRMRPAK
jgi:hypothetical protein